MRKNIFGIHNFDARRINEIIDQKIVDVTITSPPYYNLKDYGYSQQIGFGQDYQQYLRDLKLVFDKVFRITKDTGSLWVIIDTFRKDGEVVTLPFDFSNVIKDVGWKLQEVIIWGKDRTVPWAHKGQMRNLFEYILVFSKSSDYNFFVDEVRDYESLKRWWVKYPERYNPRGKTPDAIWNFDIPTQGSWGNGYLRHFCPLPEEMMAQIIKLTTKEGDVVFDPFAGSGAVLFQAEVMKRKFIGFELNHHFIKMFKNYLSRSKKRKSLEYEFSQKNLIERNKFQELIFNLRSLKFARVLYQKIIQSGISNGIKILVKREKSQPKRKNAILVVNYTIFARNFDDAKYLLKLINSIASKPPLSKYGIEPNFLISCELNDFISLLENKRLYMYNVKSFYKYKDIFRIKDLSSVCVTDAIISDIKLDLDEKDFA